MTIAEQYITKNNELYKIKPDDVEQMYQNADEINKAFAGYTWEDVSWAIARFYSHKNDKTRPRIAQILAILEASDRKRDYVDEDDDTDVQPAFPRPRTNIRIIQDSFNKLIDVLMDCNVIPDKDGKFNGHASLLYDDGFVMLNPVQNLRWQVEDAINAHPNAFAPFPNMTLWEQLALAVQNHFITLHRRTWA